MRRCPCRPCQVRGCEVTITIHDIEQRSPEWDEIRRGIPTASDFDRIITLVKGEPTSKLTQETFIAELIDQIIRPGEQETFQGNSHTMRGNELEDEAVAMYSMIYDGADIKRVGFITNDELGAGASPDFLVGDKGGGEVKCPGGKKHVLYMMQDKLPDEYKAQVHGNLAVSKRDWWDFISYCPGHPLFVVRVVRNEYTERVEIALREFNKTFQFWKNKIITE